MPISPMNDAFDYQSVLIIFFDSLAAELWSLLFDLVRSFKFE